MSQSKMLVTLFLLTVVMFVTPRLSQSQWTQQTNGLSFWIFGNAIDACDKFSAIIATTNGVYKTVDGGNKWRALTIPDNAVIDICMIDSSYIWMGDGFGKIYATQDGGQNWELQYYDTTKTKFINYIEMFDLNNGVAMGDHFDPMNYPAGPLLVLNTSDGGHNWTSVNDSAFGGWSGDTWRRIDFTDINTGYFFPSGVNPQKLYKTIDGGAKWQQLNFPGSYIQIINFFDKNIGLASRSDNVYRTVDGGINWETFTGAGFGWGNDFEFAPEEPSKVWMTDNNSLFFSSDTGRTWTLQLRRCAGRDIVFVDHYNGWILADSGKVFHTSTGGITSVHTERQLKAEQYCLMQNSPNPFNASTKISYVITKPCFVRLSIFNLLGEKIEMLVNEMQSTGTYQIDWYAGDLPGGTYFYRLKADNKFITKKMLLLR